MLLRVPPEVSGMRSEPRKSWGRATHTLPESILESSDGGYRLERLSPVLRTSSMAFGAVAQSCTIRTGCGHRACVLKVFGRLRGNWTLMDTDSQSEAMTTCSVVQAHHSSHATQQVVSSSRSTISLAEPCSLDARTLTFEGMLLLA